MVTCRCTTEGDLCGKREGAGSNRGMFFFSSFSFCLCMCGNDQRFVHFLHINAKSPPAFPKYKWTNIRRGEQKILNKCNKFG